MRSTGTRNLPPGAGAAQRRILELIEGELLAVVAPPSKSSHVAPPAAPAPERPSVLAQATRRPSER